jgi:UDP:flavonoid glycosyltransferase YjiC (YdhE family)
VAPESVPYKHLNSNMLRARIMEASSPGMRQRAKELGRRMREKNGIQNAVAPFEQLLAARRMVANRFT